MVRRSDIPIQEAVRRRLIVVEREASLLVAEVAEKFDETVVLAQLRDEAAADFAERALVRIASDTLSRHHYGEAVLLAAPDADDATLSARRLIALAIAAHAEANTALQQLVLIAPGDTPERGRAQLLELTDDLMLGEASKPLPVRLRFVAGSSPAKATLPTSEGPPAVVARLSGVAKSSELVDGDLHALVQPLSGISAARTTEVSKRSRRALRSHNWRLSN